MTSTERSTRERGPAGLKDVVVLVALIALGIFFALGFASNQSIRCARGPRATDLQCVVRQTVFGVRSDETVVANDFRSARLDHRGRAYYLVVDTATAPVDIAQTVGVDEADARAFESQIGSIAAGTGETATVESRPTGSGGGWLVFIVIEGLILFVVVRGVRFVIRQRRR